MRGTAQPPDGCPGSRSWASRFSGPTARCIVLLFSLGLFGTATSWEEHSCERDFRLERVREVRIPQGGYLREASGLTGLGGTLWSVTDKSDAAIFRLEPTRQEEVVIAQEVPLEVPPSLREALKRCGGHGRGRLDLEGIAALAGGPFFLLSEKYRAALITRVDDPEGPSPRATAQEVLCIPGRNHSKNDGLEGLSAFPGGILALEEGKGWPSRRLYRCRFPGRQCSLLTSAVLNGRTPGLTLLDPNGARLLLLNTSWPSRGSTIREMRAGEATPDACLLDLGQAREAAKDRTDLPPSFQQEGGPNHEGIHFDPITGRLYLINDNNATWNQMFFGNAEKEPTLLLIFTRQHPSSPSSR